MLSHLVPIAERLITGMFQAIHSLDAKEKLRDFHIGTLVDSKQQPKPDNKEDAATQKTFLNPKNWQPITLNEIYQVNHDSFMFQFKLPGKEQALGLPVGQHVFVRMRSKNNGEMVQRAYTPVAHGPGFVDFLVK